MEISDWLSGKQDYNTGVELYKKYGTNNYLKELFAEGEDDYNREKLTEELQQLGRDVKPVYKFKRTLSDPEEDFSKLPEVVQNWIEAAKLLFKQNAHRQSMLCNLPGKQERGELAHKILAVDDELQELYWKIDFYKITKELPPELPEISLPEEMSALDIKEEIQRLSVQISKQKNNTKRAEDVKAWQARKALLSNYLHELV